MFRKDKCLWCDAPVFLVFQGSGREMVKLEQVDEYATHYVIGFRAVWIGSHRGAYTPFRMHRCGAADVDRIVTAPDLSVSVKESRSVVVSRSEA